MLYLATPSGADVRAAKQAGLLGCMTTPAQGNVIPPGALHACDNGKFGKGWTRATAWFAWLKTTVDRQSRDRCLRAAAPDVPMDAAATLTESLPWLERTGHPGRIRCPGRQQARPHPLGLDRRAVPRGPSKWKVGPGAHRLSRHAGAARKNSLLGQCLDRPVSESLPASKQGAREADRCVLPEVESSA